MCTKTWGVFDLAINKRGWVGAVGNRAGSELRYDRERVVDH